MKIVVGVDGSEHSLRAVAWCAKYAEALSAEVIAVHAVQLPVYPSTVGFIPMPVFLPADRDQLEKALEETWCKALAEAKIPFRSTLIEGYPADVIRQVANAEDADLVVVGRRGLGGFSEFVLGSTSHHLSHQMMHARACVPAR
jgi:nucleotide-binding universal stress UspA family protein